jgi:hypothetical protein
MEIEKIAIKLGKLETRFRGIQKAGEQAKLRATTGAISGYRAYALGWHA